MVIVMENQTSLPIAKYIKEEIGEEIAAANHLRNRKGDVKQEQEKKTNTIDFDKSSEPEYKTTCLGDVIIKEELDVVLDVEAETDGMELEMTYPEISFKQECGVLSHTKDETHVEYDIEEEKTSYSCNDSDSKSEFSLQVQSSKNCDEAFQISNEQNEDKNDKPFSNLEHQCEVCGRKFKSVKLLNRHKKGVHGKMNYECECCLKIFKHKQSLVYHAKTVHGNITTTCECEHCHKIFSSDRNLDRHVKAVHDQIKYVCKYCNKVFSYKLNHDHHVKAIHDKIKYQCQSCHELFDNKYKLANHVKAIHDNIKYECEYCHKVFNQKHHLVNHVKAIHDKVKYACEYCHELFSYKHNLVNHVKAIHEQVEHECTSCHKTFSSKRNLDRHLRVIQDKIKHGLYLDQHVKEIHEKK